MNESGNYFGSTKQKLMLLLCLIIVGIFPKVYSRPYFQQKVNYSIDVTLNDKSNELTAFEQVEYTNNSPDTLRFIYFHLWPNGYSNNKTDLAKQLINSKGKERLFNDPELSGYMDSLDFKVDNRAIGWRSMPNQPDICQLVLSHPLYPGHSILISTPFHVKIPKGVTSRLGHIGQSYQISQWYPKPAVYDNTGWHQMPYLDQGEFYSEFGSFDVRITLPDNYVVGATGELQNKHEEAWLDKLAADTSWVSASKLGNVSFPVSSAQTKTLRYTQQHIHDFAWFADKRFHVLKSKVILPRSGKEVTTWLMFTNRQSALWRNAIPYINHAILDLSAWIGDYPYSSFTAVQSALNAGLGMEYPTITVIGLTRDAYSLDNVIVHECCHNWFYGALGSNERRFPYLDEGITTSYEERYMAKWYPDKKLWVDYVSNLKQAKFLHIDKIPMERKMELEWLTQARRNEEQPVNLTSTDYSTTNYTLMLYNKAAMCFHYLRAYLGDSVYDALMHDYYRAWMFKHPQPDDLRRAFEEHTDKDLHWFFDDLLGTTKRLDYKMVSYKNHRLLVRNVGELISPVLIAGMKGDSVCSEKWVDGFRGQQWIDVPAGDFTSFKIDPDHEMPELDRMNNNMRTSGLFPTADPIQPQLLFSIDNPEKHVLMYIPAVNWNAENGFMVGVALHNGFIIPKPLEYLLMPFYTFNGSQLAGYGKVSYNITPYNTVVRLAKVTVEGTQFGAPGNKNYQKLMTGFDISFRPDKIIHPMRQSLYGRYILASDLYQIEHGAKATLNSYVQLGYRVQRISPVNPYSLVFSLESGAGYQKAAVELNYKLSYTGRDAGLEMRLFAGTMLHNASSQPYYALAAGGRSGSEQYLYEGTYPDRFSAFPTTFFSRQMTVTEGGLVSPVNEQLGYSSRLVSLSLSSSLPGIAANIGIKPFVNMVLTDHGLDSGHPSPFFAEAGLKFGLWNLFEIQVPLLVTSNIQSISGSIKDRVRIVFNLDFSKQGKVGM